MSLRTQMNGVYSGMAPADIPWNMSEPPALLVELVESGWVTPCDAVDLGCGAGNYAAWLASRGFRMTGLDLSDAALEMARRLSVERGVECDWRQADLREPITDSLLLGAFDFAYDWEVLHHVFPEHREAFVGNVHRMLRPGGRYFSVCFSEEDPSFEGRGRHRRSRIGTDLYFSSETEMRELFEPLFQIERLDSTQVPSKSGGQHVVIRAVMIRIQESGVRSQDSGVGSQESGVRESGVRSQGGPPQGNRFSGEKNGRQGAALAVPTLPGRPPL